MKVKLKLDGLNFDRLLEVANLILKGLADNPSLFPNPNPSLPELAGLTTTLQERLTARIAAEKAATLALVELYEAAAALRTALMQEAAYVENKSGGDALVIGKSNMGVRAPRRRIGPMPRVERLRTWTSDYPGAVKWRCKRLAGAKAYLVQVCTGNPSEEANWHYATTATKASGLVSGLPLGQVWLRVAAKGTYENPGPWSDPALEVVRGGEEPPAS